MEQTGTPRLRFRQAAGHPDRANRESREPFIRKPHRLEAAHFGGVTRQTVMRDHALFVDERFDLTQEPRIVCRDCLHVLDREAFTKCLCDLEQAVGRTLGQSGGDDLAALAFEFGHAIEPVQAGF